MPPTDTAELRRLWEAATQGQNWQEEVLFAEACKLSLPALLDELEALREEVRRLQEVVNAPTYRQALALLAGKDASDRRMKAIGAAEELEKVSKLDWFAFTNVTPQATADMILRRAEQLRQEAEGK